MERKEFSARGGKKIDELQKGLQKKVKKLAAFESIDLEQAKTDVLRVEALEAGNPKHIGC